MNIADSRIKSWVYVLALLGIFVFSLWGFIVEGKIVFGSMVSWQHFPVNMHYFQNIIHGKYPLFDFLFSVGFDAVGDSQQNPLHPLRILLVLIGVEPVQVSTFFLVAHIFIGGLGVYLYTQFMTQKSFGDSPLVSFAPFFSTALILLSLAFYTNILHMVFLCALAYFPFMLLLTEKIIITPRRRYFFLLALVVTSMLLVGNYCIQWITLLSLMVYLASLVFMDMHLAYRAFIVMLAIAFGFLVALVQLIPTFDLMGFSSRYDLGDWQMFYASANPLSWFGYFSPGALYLQFKYAQEAYWSYTGNNVISSVHYMGLIPLALVFYSIWKRKTLPREVSLFHWVGLVMVLRALGVFSVINIFLNMLPIFGQFRIPVRSFFVLDFVLAMVSAYVLASNIDRSALRKVISTLLVVTSVFNLFSMASMSLWETMASEELPIVSWLEYGYSFGGCLILSLALLLMSNRFLSIIDKRKLVVGLVLLSIIDLGVHRIGAPLHWDNPIASDMQAQLDKVDASCEEVGASRVWMDFKWPDFDLPRFPFTPSKAPHYVGVGLEKNVELYGTSCYFGDSVITSTLTPGSIKQAMKWAEENLTHNEFLSFMGVLGYGHFARLKSESTKIIRIDDVDITKAPVPTEAMLNKLEYFLNTQSKVTKGRFSNLFQSMYEKFVQWRVSDWFPRQRMKVTPLPQIGSVLALAPPMYYLILDDQGGILPYTAKGTFLIFSGDVVGPVEVVYTPVGFVVGLMGSLMALVLLIVIAFSKALKPLFQYYGNASEAEAGNQKVGNFIASKIHQVAMGFQKFLVSPLLKKYGGIFLAGSVTVMPLVALFFTRIDNAFPFIFLILILIVVYRLTYLLSSDRNIALGLTIFLGSNFVIGKIFYLTQSILFSKKTQMMIMEKLSFIADSVSMLN